MGMATVEEEPKTQEVKGDDGEEMPALENQDGPKLNRGEKKARKTLTKLGMKQFAGITRMTLKYSSPATMAASLSASASSSTTTPTSVSNRLRPRRWPLPRLLLLNQANLLAVHPRRTRRPPLPTRPPRMRLVLPLTTLTW